MVKEGVMNTMAKPRRQPTKAELAVLVSLPKSVSRFKCKGCGLPWDQDQAPCECGCRQVRLLSWRERIAAAGWA